MLDVKERPQTEVEDQAFIDGVIAEYAGKPGGLLSILERVQERNRHKYLSADVLRWVARKTGVPLSRVYSVATFYSFFNLAPQGDHTVCICRGTACHTRGSRDLLNNAKLILGIGDDPEGGADKVSLTTQDKKFTIRTVACFGQCALAPVVEVDREIYGRMNERELRKVIDRVDQKGTK
jgi:NADH-quinone oxidoreductase subunit E